MIVWKYFAIIKAVCMSVYDTSSSLALFIYVAQMVNFLGVLETLSATYIVILMFRYDFL